MTHEIRRGDDRGSYSANGIRARFSFHFGGWRAPGRERFGALRVLNEDRIVPGAGFPPHPHERLEILMFPLSGGIAHWDSLGNTFTALPDEAVHMSAGTGLEHSQFNAFPDRDDHHLQVWLSPRNPDRPPRIARRAFPAEGRTDRWQLVASGSGRDGSLAIDQHAEVWRARLGAGVRLGWRPRDAHRRLYLHVATGKVEAVVDGDAPVSLVAGDALAAVTSPRFDLVGLDDGAELLLFDLPAGE